MKMAEIGVDFKRHRRQKQAVVFGFLRLAIRKEMIVDA
jgi:hypothetical protein